MRTALPFELPRDPALKAEAALRLLESYLLHRGEYVHADLLEAELDEAIAGRPLYTDEEKMG